MAAVDVDNDTLAACLKLWATDQANLPALFATPPQAGRLSGKQAMPYAAISSAKSREAQRYSAGVFKDYRKVTITLRGEKADVSQGIGFVLALFNGKLGLAGQPTLAYPSTDPASGLPWFICWWPLNDGVLTEDADVKQGDDVWIGTVEGEVRSVRMD